MAKSLLFVLFLVGCGTTGLPRQAVQHNREGARLLAEGALDDAEARFHLALEYHPKFAEPRANLGLVALQRGDLDRAEHHLRGAIRLNEDFALAWGNLGIVLERKRRDDEAREAYERALSIDPGIVNVRRNLARLLARKGEFVPARAHLLRLIQIVPRDDGAASLLAYCDLRLGRPAAAEARANAVLERNEDAAAARVVRGLARMRSGDLEGAGKDLQFAAADPLVGREARTRLAVVYVLRDDIPSARALVDRLLREEPRDAAVLLVAASASMRAGQPAEARRHAEAALRLKHDLDEARIVLAQARLGLGDDACAERALSDFVGRTPHTLRAAEQIRRDIQARRARE